MKRNVLHYLAANALALAATSLWAEAHATSPLPPGSDVAGQTIAEWSANWWQWAVSFDTTMDNPFSDTTGAHAGLGQAGPVFFLAGTTGATATRSFPVPANRPLLVPLLVAEIAERELDPDPAPPNPTPAEIRTEVNNLADLIDELHATINGAAVPDLFSHREESPDFSMNAAPNNIVGLPEGDSGVAVADGYWLMLEPLSPGESAVLNFGGGISQFDFRVDVTAKIFVPEPASVSLLGLGCLLAGCRRNRRRAASSCSEARWAQVHSL